MMKILHYYQWLTTLILTLYLIPHIRGIHEELVVSNIQDGFGDLDKPVGKNSKRGGNMINFDINILAMAVSPCLISIIDSERSVYFNGGKYFTKGNIFSSKTQEFNLI